jgi:predicted nucleic acid-binding protein
MNFADIAQGATLFIDANVFVYAFSSQSQLSVASREMLERVDRGEIVGFTSTHVLAETAHRLMTLEACTIHQWPFAGIVQRLRQHRTKLQQLSAYRQGIDAILTSAVKVMAPTPGLVLKAADTCRMHGLLCNDALVVAIMQSIGLTDLASNDADFDRVPWLVRYSPT